MAIASYARKPFMDDRKQVLKDAEPQFKNGNVIADAGNTTRGKRCLQLTILN